MSDREMDGSETQVCVVGGGPAGLAAAASASAAGAKVLLIDNNPELGGQIWRANQGVSPFAARPWLASLDRVDVWRSTRLIDADVGPDCVTLTVVHEDRVRSIAADRLILACGARERFLPFPGWTSTGVLGVGGIQAFAKQGFEVEGMRVLIAGSGPLLLAVAHNLRRRGAKILGLVEQAPRSRVLGFAASLSLAPRKLAQAARLKAGLLGIPQYYDAWPSSVTRRWGAKQPKSKLGGELQIEVVNSKGSSSIFGADLMATGFGLVPDTRIAAYLGCRIEAGAVVVDALQATSQGRIFAAGESTGIGGVDLALVEGRVAGFAAAGASALAERCAGPRRREQAFADRLNHAFALRDELRSLPQPDTIVCRCEDVRWGDLSGALTMRAAKLQTRCGMGSCQGRVCGPALEFLTGVGAERIRPPFEPVSMGLLAQATGSTDD